MLALAIDRCLERKLLHVIDLDAPSDVHVRVGSELRGTSGAELLQPAVVDDDPKPSTVLVEEEGQVSRSVEEADDLDVVAADPVEDQVVREPVRRPGANALGMRGAELPRTARLRVLQDEFPTGSADPDG